MHTMAGSVLLYISWLVCLHSSFIFIFTWDVVFLRGVFTVLLYYMCIVCFFFLKKLALLRLCMDYSIDFLICFLL